MIPDAPPGDRTNLGHRPRMNSAARRAARAARERRFRRVLLGALAWSGWFLAASLWLSSTWRPMASAPVGVPVAVRTEVKWVKAYVDSVGVARSYEDGVPVRATGWKDPD